MGIKAVDFCRTKWCTTNVIAELFRNNIYIVLWSMDSTTLQGILADESLYSRLSVDTYIGHEGFQSICCICHSYVALLMTFLWFAQLPL